MMTQRYTLLHHWAQRIANNSNITLHLISGDASFRKYYRAENRIWVDAPPETEKNAEFLANAAALQRCGVLAPEVYAADLAQGFLCVSDLGDQSLFALLSTDNVLEWYQRALALLPKLYEVDLPLPDFDSVFMDRENAIFPEWFLSHHLGLPLDASTQALLSDTFTMLTANNLAQPQVVMHRDFHSRNLMVVDQTELAVIDFQDMVRGPVTYDMVSLIKDCYCDWSAEVRQKALQQAFHQSVQCGVIDGSVSLEQFTRWFDLTGMQRHLKAIGIFARLHHRDGKSGYLKDIPRTLVYVDAVSARYPELAAFSGWLRAVVLPRLSSQKEPVSCGQ